MRRAGPILFLLVFAAWPCQARVASRSYLAFGGGASFLTGDVSGDVIDSRSTGLIELGVGYQLSKTALLEFTYGWGGTFQKEGDYIPLEPGELPADTQRVYKLGLNPLMLRMRYAPGGERTEYLKPELSAGFGFMQVSRLLRNVPFVPPEETSQLLASLEFGFSGLVVFSKNFMATLGARYTFTERRGIVDQLQHADNFAFLIGFRTFLPSPRDVAEP